MDHNKGAVAQSLLKWLPSTIVNRRNHEHKTALQIAFEEGEVEVAQVLFTVAQGVIKIFIKILKIW